MSPLPRRSSGVLLSALDDDRGIAYDLVTEVVHHLNATACALVAACDGETDRDEVAARWAASTGADPATIGADVAAGLEALTDLGLVGRDEAFEPPTPRPGSTADALAGSAEGLTHPVLDRVIRFRSTDRDLLATVDAHLGTGVEHADGLPAVIDLSVEDDGQVCVTADQEWRFVSVSSFLDQVTTLINEYGAQAPTSAALHAGAVRSPAGEVVLLPALSGAGKSTLTGAFVAAGWDYLSDEIVGLRPASRTAVGYPKRLALDPTSCDVLGIAYDHTRRDVDPAALGPDVVRVTGEAGPVVRVVFPTYTDGAECAFEPLDPPAALDLLLANTLNLAHAGEPALDALCEVAAEVPAVRLTHGGAGDAVEAITRLR